MGIVKELGHSVKGIHALPKKSSYDSHHQRKWGLDNLCVHRMALSLPRLKHRCSDVGLSSDAARAELSLGSGRSIMSCLLMSLALSFLLLGENGTLFQILGKLYTQVHISTHTCRRVIIYDGKNNLVNIIFF